MIALIAVVAIVVFLISVLLALAIGYNVGLHALKVALIEGASKNLNEDELNLFLKLLEKGAKDETSV